MMKKNFYYLSLLYVALFSSCSNDDTPSQFEETAYLTIAPYKGLYENWIEVTDKPAYIATKEGDNIRKTIESISGFDKIYEKGYEYVIKVRVKPVTDTAGEFWNDAFGYTYTLIEVISKEKKEYDTRSFTVASEKTVFSNWLGVTDIPAYAVITEEGGKETIISISGFDEIYEAGYRYVIKVKANYDADLQTDYWPNPYGGFTYSLMEVISKEK